MEVIVDARTLVPLLNDFVSGTKTMFNLLCDGETLFIQMLGEYTMCTSMPVQLKSGSSKETVNISVWISKEVDLLDKEGSVLLDFHGEAVSLMQESCSLLLLRQYEGRRDFPSVEGLPLKPFFADRLQYLVHSMISCNGMSRELSISDPDPVFSGGHFYLDYMQSVFVENIDYPEMCITQSVLHSLAFRLSRKADYAYLPEYNTLYVLDGNKEFWVPTVNYNISSVTVSTIDKKIAESVEVASLCFKDYVDKMLVLANVYPKKNVSLIIGGSSFGLTISTNETNCFIGDSNIKDVKVCINLTSAQVAVIAKLFGKADEVKCYRGGNCICLKSMEKNMLIAGILY